MKRIDFTEVIELAKSYMEEIHREGITSDKLSDYDAYIFEAVIEAIYGKDIFEKEINPILEEL